MPVGGSFEPDPPGVGGIGVLRQRAKASRVNARRPPIACVALVTAQTARGGFTAVVQEAEDLVRRGVEVVVISPPGARTAELPPAARHLPLGPGPRDVVRAVLTLRRMLRALDPALVHLHGRSAGVTGRLAAIGTPAAVAYTPHGVSTPRHWLVRRVDAMVQRVLGRGTTIWVFVGDAEQREWCGEHGVPPGPMVIVPNAVDPDGVRSRGAERSPAEPALHPESRLTVLVPNPYEPRKRTVDALAALSRGVDPRVQVRVVGSTARGGERHREALRRLAVDAGVADRVELSGESGNLPAEMAAADLILFTSDTEGLPIRALEALSIGKPCAWADTPAHAEVFGAAGRRYPPGDVAAIARILDAPDQWAGWAPPEGAAARLHARLAARRAAGLSDLLAFVGPTLDRRGPHRD